MKNNCCGGYSLPSSNNTDKVLLEQIKREVKELLETTEAKLLCQSKKIDETMVYIKNNLSNAIRDLLDSMDHSGELDDIITEAISSSITILESKLSEVYDVAEFGAIGDGFTDDSGAINTALATNLNDNKVIKFQNKVYGAKGTIRLYSNTVIDLNNATIKDIETNYNDVNRDSAGLRFMNNVTSVSQPGYGALKNILVKNGTFEGCKCGVLFALFHGENIEFNNVTFSNCCMGTHIFDLGGCKNIRFINCKFSGCSLPSDLTYREMIQPDYAHYRGLPYWGNELNYAYDELPTVDLLVEGCLFEKGNGNTYPNAIGTHGSLEGKHTNIVIRNNIFRDSTYSAIRIPRVENLYIQDNVFINCNPNGSERSFIWLEQGYANGQGTSNKNILIEDNIIKTELDNMNIIFFKVWGDNLPENYHRDIVVRNNMYHGTYSSTLSGADFIQMGNVKDVIVESNIVNKAKNFIWCIGGNAVTKGLSVISNRMIDCRTFIGKPSTATLNNRIAKNNSWESNGSITYKINNLYEVLYSSQGQGSGNISLNSGINNFDYILVATGGIGNNTYSTVAVYPFDIDNGFRPGEDTYNVLTATGNTIINIASETTINIQSTNDLVRKIIGVKIL
jgi:hypothetical protein